MIQIDSLIRDFSALPEVEAVALGGSRAGSDFDDSSDYDLYLYTTATVAKEARFQILSPYCRYMEIGNEFWEKEDNCILNNGTDIDIIYRDMNCFILDVASVVEQFQSKNGYTTCMWHNLCHCKILYDRNGRLTAAVNRFSIPYPEELRNNIISRNVKLLRSALPCYQTQIKKAVSRGDLISINHRITAFMESYFDILFALNRMTHPGEKRLISYCLQNCPLIPAQFESNLKMLLHDQAAVSSRIVYDVNAIIDNLMDILPNEYRPKRQDVK